MPDNEMITFIDVMLHVLYIVIISKLYLQRFVNCILMLKS